MKRIKYFYGMIYIALIVIAIFIFVGQNERDVVDESGIIKFNDYQKILGKPRIVPDVPKIAEIKSIEKDKDIIINTATGDKVSTCAATSAAFVNGLKAMSVTEGNAMMLPVLKFSYYNMLTDKKMQILKLLNKPNCCNSLEELSGKTKMSLPLISYHINGNLKSEGLKDMGLIETTEHKGKIAVKLSTFHL